MSKVGFTFEPFDFNASTVLKNYLELLASIDVLKRDVKLRVRGDSKNE